MHNSSNNGKEPDSIPSGLRVTALFAFVAHALLFAVIV
jgi:hypothetical protein